MKSADYFCSNPAYKVTGRMNEFMTGKQHPLHNLHLGGGNNVLHSCRVCYGCVYQSSAICMQCLAL